MPALLFDRFETTVTQRAQFATLRALPAFSQTASQKQHE
jgi:hypothetical protein